LARIGKPGKGVIEESHRLNYTGRFSRTDWERGHLLHGRNCCGEHKTFRGEKLGET